MGNVKIDIDDLKCMKQFRENGYSLQEVADMYDITKSKIIYWVNRYNFDFPLKDTNTNIEEEEELVAELYRDGYSISEIERSTSLSKLTISYRLYCKLGIISEKSRMKFEKIKDNLVEDFNNKVEFNDMIKKYRISKPMLKIFLMELNLIEKTTIKLVTNHEYFKTLNNHKAEILGIIFSTAKFTPDYSNEKVVMFSVGAKYKYLLEMVIEELFNNCAPSINGGEDKGYRFRLPKGKISQDLLKYGMESNVNIPEKYFDSFVNGYCMYASRVERYYIHISVKNDNYLEFFKKYLEYIGIDEYKTRCKSIVISKRNYRRLILNKVKILKERALNGEDREYYKNLLA